MDISQRILDGDSLSIIAKDMGVSHQRISQICARDGIDVQALRQERKNRIVSRIRDLASEGLDLGAIADSIGISYYSVLRLTLANGIKAERVKTGTGIPCPTCGNPTARRGTQGNRFIFSCKEHGYCSEVLEIADG